MNIGIAIVIFVGVVLLGGYLLRESIGVSEREVQEVEGSMVIAENLEIPWEIVFLPDGNILVTERSGSLLRIGKDQQRYSIEGVQHIGEGGLLGMALHPDFEENRWVYLYFTTQTQTGLENRVERYELRDDQLTGRTILLSGIPGAAFHDGGRIAFGPDGLLYITTGDAGDASSAQNPNSLSGAILRITTHGDIPEDNPFGNEVYSYGHRNPQGLTWDERGRLWSTEHGRSGVLSGLDELNLIEKGANYGWPVVEGDETRAGMKSPVLHSGSRTTWAPASAEYWDGSIFFGGLRGEALYEAKLTERGSTVLKTHFFKEFGRVRTVRLGPDNMLYLTTSNRDGRGEIKPGDDKIVRINPKIFR